MELIGKILWTIGTAAAGVALRMLTNPPVTYLDLIKHAAAVVLLAIFVAEPVAMLISAQIDGDDRYVLSVVLVAIGFYGRDAIDKLMVIGARKLEGRR